MTDKKTLEIQALEKARKRAKLGTGKRFKLLKKSLKKRGARTPGALAAWIGRKKYGTEKFAEMSAKGKRK